MENSKPRLFIFGDSFVQWHLPEVNHWTERFSKEYNVYRLGCSGASNEHITYQLGVLPEYKKGDRIIIVLTEPSRLPKWMWAEEYDKFCKYKQSIKDNKPNNASTFIKQIMKLLVYRDKLIQEKGGQPHEKVIDSPLQVYNMLGMLRGKLKAYKPVYLTWSTELIKSKLLENLVTLIKPGSYSTVADENTNIKEDYHPGEKGGKVWYNKAKFELDNWKDISFTTHKVGTPFFKEPLI